MPQLTNVSGWDQQANPSINANSFVGGLGVSYGNNSFGTPKSLSELRQDKSDFLDNYSRIFGTPRNLPDPSIDQGPHNIITLAQAYNGFSSPVFGVWILRRLSAQDVAIVKDVFPMTYFENSNDYSFSIIEFHNHIASRVPTHGLPQQTSSSRTQISGSLDQYGQAYALDLAFYKTPEGKRHMAACDTQVSNACMEAMCLSGTHMALTCKPDVGPLSGNGDLVTEAEYRQILISERDVAFMFHKSPHALSEANTRLNAILSKRGVQNADLLWIPQGLEGQVIQTSLNRSFASSGNVDKLAQSEARGQSIDFNRAFDGMGNRVLVSRDFHITASPSDNRDPFFRRSVFGGFNMMRADRVRSCTRETFRTEYQDIDMFDERRGNWYTVSMKEALQYSGYDNPELGPQLYHAIVGPHKTFRNYLRNIGLNALLESQINLGNVSVPDASKAGVQPNVVFQLPQLGHNKDSIERWKTTNVPIYRFWLQAEPEDIQESADIKEMVVRLYNYLVDPANEIHEGMFPAENKNLISPFNRVPKVTTDAEGREFIVDFINALAAQLSKLLAKQNPKLEDAIRYLSWGYTYLLAVTETSRQPAEIKGAIDDFKKQKGPEQAWTPGPDTLGSERSPVVKIQGSSASSSSGDGLIQIDKVIDWETFAKFLTQCANLNHAMPVSFILWRMGQIYKAAPVMKLVSGSSTGITAVAFPDTMTEVDAAQKKLFVNVTFRHAAIPIAPKQIARLNNVFSRGYVEGNSCDFWDPNKDHHRAHHTSPSSSLKDIFVTMVPGNWQPKDQFMIIEGNYNPAFVARSDLSPNRMYPTAQLYAKYWGWSHTVYNVHEHFGGITPYYNTLAWESSTLILNPGETQKTHIRDKGPWGPNSNIPSFEVVPSGIGSLMHPVRDGKPFVVGVM